MATMHSLGQKGDFQVMQLRLASDVLVAEAIDCAAAEFKICSTLSS